MGDNLTDALDLIKHNASLYASKRDDVDLGMLVEEIGELAEALRQMDKNDSKWHWMHSGTVIHELQQIGGITANWLARELARKAQESE